MSRDNIEIVQRFYEAWSRDEFPGPVELMHEDIEYVNPDEAVEPGTRRGLDEFAEAVQKLLHSWEFWRADVEDFRTAGDQVAVVVRYRTRGRGSGIDVEGRESALWTLRDGKAVRYQWFHGANDAFESLRESAESDENLELVRRAIDAWNRQDIDDLLALTDAEVVFVNAPNAVEPGTRHGREELATVLRKQWEALPGGLQQMSRLHVRGDQIISEGHISREMPGSDIRIGNDVLLSWKIKDGKIARIEVLAGGSEFQKTRETLGL